jgi:hypothetical protein
MDDNTRWIGFVSLTGSVLSTIFTLYFWLVRVRNERPKVRLFATGCSFDLSSRRGDERFLPFRVDVIAANCSVLPNAILKAVLRWQTRDGAWEERNVNTLAMPINLPASHTVLLPFTGMLKLGHADVVEKSEQRSEIIRSHLAHWFTDPPVFQVELWTLQDYSIKTVLMPATWTTGVEATDAARQRAA